MGCYPVIMGCCCKDNYIVSRLFQRSGYISIKICRRYTVRIKDETMYEDTFFHYKLLFTPNHFVYYVDVTLYDLYYYVADILAGVYVNRSAVIVVVVHRDGSVNGLQ